MRTILLILSSIFISVFAMAQTGFTGAVLGEDGKPVVNATVAVLKSADSTLIAFGITNDAGRFGISRVPEGAYVLQVACLGYVSYYERITFPAKAGDYGVIVLKQVTFQLPSVEIRGEHIPVIIKKDTVEYNAAAFKTRPDAVAEDLLRKLPGVEVDRAGNIRAMGEDVKNVMVDGKEFFSSDPKVATKNLPADAISKVQVYDKKSESSELAGIEDGSRDKTINLLLKDGKKQAWIGETSAGAGTDDRYALSGKAYRFTRKDQFAALGMLNNINKYGFSFQDYIDFNGGLPAMMSGGSLKLTITSDNEIPVNFGQSVNGLVSSGAGGLNYSFDISKNNRLYASYLGSGSNRTLDQTTLTQNLLPGSTYSENTVSSDHSSNNTHRLNLGWKDKSDSARTILFNANLALAGGRGTSSIHSQSFIGSESFNSMKSDIGDKRIGISGNGSFSYMARGKNLLKLYTLGANTRFTKSLNENDRLNLLRYAGIETPVIDDQFRNLAKNGITVGVFSEFMIRLGSGVYLLPQLRMQGIHDRLDREQGLITDTEQNTDSLSPDFGSNSLQLVPTVKLRWNHGKQKLVPGISLQVAATVNELNDGERLNYNYFRILPSLSWEYEIRTSHRLSVDYSSFVNEPALEIMLPVVDNSNPQALFYGNRELKPETVHELFANWILFDQYSRSSVFARIGSRYTRDKFGYDMSVSDSLVQVSRAINTKSFAEYMANADFSRPVQRMGINLHLSLETRITKGSAVVNDVENRTSGFLRSLKLSFDNVKKEKWDLELGAGLQMNDAKYSIMTSLDNRYLSWNYFADLSITPTDKWNIGFNADIMNYGAGNYSSEINIPLLSAEIGYNFLKNNRAGLKLECFDILDKNKGLERVNELNYIREVRSNNIGRYLMLSFHYRLNKAAGTGNGLELKMKTH